MIPEKEKKIYYYYQDGDNRYIVYKDAVSEVEIKNYAEIMLKLFKQSSKSVNKFNNIYVKCQQKKFTKIEKELSEKEKSILMYEHCKKEHIKFIDDAHKLNELTNNKINMFKSGTFKKTAFTFFYETVKYIITVTSTPCTWIGASTPPASNLLRPAILPFQ